LSTIAAQHPVDVKQHCKWVAFQVSTIKLYSPAGKSMFEGANMNKLVGIYLQSKAAYLFPFFASK